MCGIVGIFDRVGQRQIDRDLLDRMNGALRHRGPDDSGLFFAPGVGLGLRRVLGYVAVYYALWASADVLILYGGLDVGWLLRVVPNQLYYAFFVPFAWWTLSPVLARED